MAETKKTGSGLHLTTGLITIVLTMIGAVLFSMSFQTGYYSFGEMNSSLIVTLLGGALLTELAAVLLTRKWPDVLWIKCLTFVVTALLAASAMLIIGDRVEGIGNCIITDYDSGHGGEEAIYMSLIGAVSLLIAMIYNIMGAFTAVGNSAAGSAKKLGLISSAAVLGVAAIVATVMLTGAGISKNGSIAGENAGTEAGTYKLSFNQEFNNIENAPDYQFLSADMRSLLKYDARSYIDVTLKLDGNGAYSLLSDYYVLEAGKRAEIGDPSGLGLVYKTTSEGKYSVNDDGTVTTSGPDHVLFELATDTYSEQMKQLMHVDLGGSDADGTYDSADYPELLAYVPETTWTLSESTITGYGKGLLRGTFMVSFNQGNQNLDNMPDYQFLSANMAGLAKADARFYIDIDLTLDGVDQYSLFADAYVLDSGKRAEIGDPSGLGLVYSTKAEGAYTQNEDGSVTTEIPTHAVFEVKTDTYSAQMKQMMNIDLNGGDADGVYDSAEYAAVLEYVPETIWTLSDQEITSYEQVKSEEKETTETAVDEDSTPEEEVHGVEIVSDDGATRIAFYPTGTYQFFFDSYSIEDAGKYEYVDGVLTLTDENGKDTTADGDPMHLHYAYSKSDQLTGDFTIPASALDFQAATADESAEPKAATVASDDEATTMTFRSDGTYAFEFASYNIVDEGTYTYADGVLTLTDANGKETTADGDPMHLHYAYSKSDQLTGDFTIPASALGFQAATADESAEPKAETIASDDEATTMTFRSDGTFAFEFASYNIVDEGTYTYADGVLTLTDANGKETTADGDPMHLHYAYSKSDQLTGDFTIPATTFIK